MKLSNEELLVLLDRVKQVLGPEVCRCNIRYTVEGLPVPGDYDYTDVILLELAAIAKVPDNWQEIAEFGDVVSRVNRFYFEASDRAWDWICHFADMTFGPDC